MIYKYESISGKTINIGSYVIPTNGLELQYAARDLDEQLGITLNRFIDGTLNNNPIVDNENSNITPGRLYVNPGIPVGGNGSLDAPFSTLQSAYDAASLVASSTNTIFIVLLNGNTLATTESVTFSKGHIFLVGDISSGTHAPIVFYGNLTFIGPSASISENHFAIQGITLIGASGTAVITFSGTFPQRLFLKDVWIIANGNVHGMLMTNTGTGSSIHSNELKLSHNGTGHYHCLNIAAGTANLDALETSGVGVAAIGVDGGSCNLRNSEIECGGQYAIDVYAGGTLTIGNTMITTSATLSDGIILRAAGAIAVVGNCTFRVPSGDAANRAIKGVPGSLLYYSNLFFLPSYTDKISSGITSAVIDSTPTFIV